MSKSDHYDVDVKTVKVSVYIEFSDVKVSSLNVVGEMSNVIVNECECNELGEWSERKKTNVYEKSTSWNFTLTLKRGTPEMRAGLCRIKNSTKIEVVSKKKR